MLKYLLLLIIASCGMAVSEAGAAKFEAADGKFLLDGKPFVVKAAELHYPRIPRPYWDQRIKMCKALGMNTICLYTFWNIHEQQPGQFDFSGQNDLREFVRLCQNNGMKVILRPGPYVCAEWEMGGLPWWLLKKEDIRLRELDPYFIERVDLFQKAVAAQVADLTIDRDGPIIMVQVENEYGSYGTDKPYVATIRDMLRNNFGSDVTLFQCDWASNFLENGLDDLVWTMNFGTGADIDSQFERLKEVRPDSPLMCSEYWSGWFDKWGAAHETRPADEMIAGIDEMLSKGISFSLYMTHGGTNWGHWAGANSPGYAPDVTSYDYDAPISESGQTSPKYHLLRKTLSKYLDKGEKLPPVPKTPAPVAVAGFEFDSIAPLFDNLPAPKHEYAIRPMEFFDQGFGSILYRTRLPQLSAGGCLVIDEPHDFAQVFINRKYIGKLDRRLAETKLDIPPCAAGDTLDILVEATGRINFGRAIKDYKGITSGVAVAEKRTDGHTFVCDLNDWEVFNLEDTPDFYSSMKFAPIADFSAADGRLPIGAYKGKFFVNRPSDTFLRFDSWGKGLVYVNGHPIGRIWEIGPQQTLYMPGCWLRKGMNEIMVFDVLGPAEAASEGLKKPIIDMVRNPQLQKPSAAPQEIDLSCAASATEGSFSANGGWQTADFDSCARGRYLCLEILEAEGVAAAAEIYLLDENARRIPRENWRAIFADSENSDGNHTADKMFDLQESTFWAASPGEQLPHRIVIDLGGMYNASALQYLPPATQSAPGAISRFRLYLSEKPFPMK